MCVSALVLSKGITFFYAELAGLAINNIVQRHTRIIAKYYNLCKRHNIQTQKHVRVINKREIMKQCSSFVNRTFVNRTFSWYFMKIMKKACEKKITEEFSNVRNSTLRSFYIILYFHIYIFSSEIQNGQKRCIW